MENGLMSLIALKVCDNPCVACNNFLFVNREKRVKKEFK